MASLDAERRPRGGARRRPAVETLERRPLVAVVLSPLVLLLGLRTAGLAARLAPLRRGAPDLARSDNTIMATVWPEKGKSARGTCEAAARRKRAAYRLDNAHRLHAQPGRVEAERGEGTRAGVLVLDAKSAGDRRLVYRRLEALFVAKRAHSAPNGNTFEQAFFAAYPCVGGGAVEHGVRAPERRPRKGILGYAQKVALAGQILFDGARRFRGGRALVVTELSRGALAQRRRDQLAQRRRGGHVVVVAEQLVGQALVVVAVRHEAEVELGRPVVLDRATCSSKHGPLFSRSPCACFAKNNVPALRLLLVRFEAGLMFLSDMRRWHNGSGYLEGRWGKTQNQSSHFYSTLDNGIPLDSGLTSLLMDCSFTYLKYFESSG